MSSVWRLRCISLVLTPDIDRLTVSALGGDDMVNAFRLHANTILLTEDGGDGNDMLIWLCP